MTPKKKQRKMAMTTNLEPETHAALKARAEKLRRPLADVARLAIEYALKKEGWA